MDNNVEQRFKLRWHGSTLMIASFVSDSRKIEVHGHCLRKGEAKFLIVSCFENRLNKWEGYKPDQHVPGSYIAWNRKFAKKLSVKKSSPSKQTGVDNPNDMVNECEKKMLVACNCRMTCSEKISEEKMQEIHRCYWDITYSQRRTCILQNVFVTETKRRKGDVDEEGSVNKRSCTRLYQLDKLQV